MSLRLFAALSLPDDVAGRLTALMQGVGGAAWRPRENLHLTLRFFGEVAEPVARDIDVELEAAGQACAPFQLKLKGAGSFGGADPHALWIGAAENPALTRLAQACEKAARRAGLAPEPRKFTPHVTVAYLKYASLDRVQAFTSRYALFETRAFDVGGFTLFESRTRRGGASLYEPVAEYPLLG